MFLNKPVIASRYTTCALAATLLLAAATAGSQPSQSPLLSRVGGVVSPNLVLNMDDSGSMAFEHMPEESFILSGKTITVARANLILMHKDDNSSLSPVPSYFKGYWTADIASNEVYQRQTRSSDVNLIYYNPQTTYRPWIQKESSSTVCAGDATYCDNSRFPNANIRAAAFNPIVPAVPATAAPVAIVSLGAGTPASSLTGDVTPSLPTGVVANDFLICLAEARSRSGGYTTPTGWTQIYDLRGGSGAPSTHRATAYYKIAGAAEANPTIGHSGSNVVAQCYAYRNVDAANPFDVTYSATNDNVSDSSIGTGNLTTVSADTLILMASHQADNFLAPATVSTPNGLAWSKVGNANAGVAGLSAVGMGLYQALKSVAGAVGPFVVTSNVSQRNSGVVLALRKGSGTALSGGADLLTPATVLNARWCNTFSSIPSGNSTFCATSDRSYTPMLFYRLKKDVSGTYLDPTVSTNYDMYDLNLDKKNGAGSAVGETFPKRTDCTAGVCTIAQERQNFANWFVYHRSRMLLARGAVAESFWNVEEKDLRVGWARIKNAEKTVDGVLSTIMEQGVRDFSDARKDALFSFVRTLTPNGGTPLQNAMWGVGKYYEAESPWADDPANPSTGTPKSCRRAYHMLVTDGIWQDGVISNPQGNYDNNVTAGFYEKIVTSGNEYQYEPKKPFADDNANYLSDFATYFFARDLRPTLDNNVVASPPGKLFWQGMINFTVGMGLTGLLDPSKDLKDLESGVKSWGTNKVDDLWHAAVNSEGRYFSAKNAEELASSLTSALNATTRKDIQEAGVATSANVLEKGNRKYIPVYKTGVWTGDVRALKLNEKGETVKAGLPELPNGEIWLASQKLPVWNSRNIYTWSGDAAAPRLFTWDTLGGTDKAALGPAVGSAELVDYLRGSDVEEKTSLYRTRFSRLGDFINSNPVLVKNGVDLGYATLTQGGASYNGYRATKAVRNGVLFVGSNDGMVHAFKDTLGDVPTTEDGKEIFAYVPRAVYPKLSTLSDKTYGTTINYHQFYVDGALVESDAFVRATSSSTAATWRNYLLGSLGAGGRAVFAFDVTDMSSPGADNVKWEFSSANDADMGYVSAPVEVGVLKDNTWVAIFGNGPSSSSGKAVLFVVNLETGSSSKIEVEGSSGVNGLGGVRIQRDALGYIENLFVGDLRGSLWKLQYSAAAASKFAVSGGTEIFNATSTAGVRQPITQAPLVYDHSQGGKLIVFGTGKLITELDRSTVDTQSMYALWDKPADTFSRPLARSLLEPRELELKLGKSNSKFYSLKDGPAIDWTTQRGWVIDLKTASPDALVGERIIYPPQKVTSNLVLFSAVAPADKVEVCQTAEGTGANFIIPIETGQNPTYKLFDTDGDSKYDANDFYAVGYATKSDGIDAILVGEKGTDPNCLDGIVVSIQNTEGQMKGCVVEKKNNSKLEDRIWRRILNPPIR